LLTVVYYTIGGVVAAETARVLERE
jgi:hypothetical protein